MPTWTSKDRGQESSGAVGRELACGWILAVFFGGWKLMSIKGNHWYFTMGVPIEDPIWWHWIRFFIHSSCDSSFRKTLHTHVEGWLSPCFWRAHLTSMMRHLLYEDALYLQICGESRIRWIRFAGSSLTLHYHELVRLFSIGKWWHDPMYRNHP